jgi:hypothetical protein
VAGSLHIGEGIASCRARLAFKQFAVAFYSFIDKIDITILTARKAQCFKYNIKLKPEMALESSGHN